MRYWCSSCKEWVQPISAPATGKPCCPYCGAYVESEDFHEADLDRRWRSYETRGC